MNPPPRGGSRPRREQSDYRSNVRFGALSAFLAATAFVAIIWIGVPTPPDERPDAPRPRAVVTGFRAEAAAWKFRPYLRFDRREPWRPLSIEKMLAETYPDGSKHRYCRRTATGGVGCDDLVGSRRFGPLATRLPSVGRPFLDLRGDGGDGRDHTTPNHTSCPRPDVVRECEDDGALYYHVVEANERLYVDYWWFFRFNDFQRYALITACGRRIEIECHDHEGDWEGITVVTAPDDDNRLAYAAFAQHDGAYRFDRPDVELVGERPVVYVARGSHASYSRRCLAACGQARKVLKIPLPEESSSGSLAWSRNSDPACVAGSHCLESLRSPAARAWAAWPGLWGRGPKDGPRSPLLQPRAEQPWCSVRWIVDVCDCPPGSRDPADLLPGVDCTAPALLRDPRVWGALSTQGSANERSRPRRPPRTS